VHTHAELGGGGRHFRHPFLMIVHTPKHRHHILGACTIRRHHLKPQIWSAIFGATDITIRRHHLTLHIWSAIVGATDIIAVF
jgi:hypothetical protein